MKNLRFIFLFIFFIPASSFSFGLFNTGFWKKNGGNDSNIQLLLHGDGSGTSIVDSSSRKHTVTSNGGAANATAQSKFGGSSLTFDGTDDYLTVPDSDDWSFGLSDFTIDFWIRFTDSTTPDVILHQQTDANNMWYLYHAGQSQVLEFRNVVGGVATIDHTVPWTASSNSWYHIAVIRFGNEFKTFINGTQVGATTVDSDGWNNNTGLLYIGANAAGIHSVAGYMDELRISKGVARWTSNFTPPLYPTGMSELACPTNYIRVPALSGYTTSNFCVAKYEMKNNGGAKSEAAGFPWASIARGTDATTAGGAWKACKDIGADYDLISNTQWQTIARNIADQNVNWSNGNAASGTAGELNRGHSDSAPLASLEASTDDNNSCIGTGETCSSTTWNSQRRTHKLSNGNVIWDFAGNVWEWVQDNNSSSQGADGYISTFIDGRQTTYGNDTFCSAPSASPYCGMGYGWTNYSTGTVDRGGSWTNNVNAGIFSVALNNAPSGTGTNMGFRCVFGFPWPSARASHGAIVIGNKMYVFHGQNPSFFTELWEYDFSTSRWNQLPSSPSGTGRASFAYGVYNGKIYITHGGQGGGGYTHASDTWEYNPSTYQWTQKSTTNTPSGRTGPTGVVIGSKFYMFGGSFGASRTNELWELDLSSFAWTQKTPSGGPPGVRYTHSAVVYNGKMYIVGGWNMTDGYSDVWEYDPVGNSWTQKTSLPAVRNSHAAIVSGTKMYVFGGGGQTNHVLEYDFSGNSWTSKTSGGNGADGASSVLYNGKMYIFGGWEASAPYLNTLWEYNITNDSWLKK